MTEPPASSRARIEAPVGRLPLIAGAAVAVAGTFLFRYLTVSFTNDHFVHLSRGRQILYGDLPIRDFFDPGGTLQYYASVGALLWSGHNLLGETILTCAFIAAGAGLTFVGAAWLSKSFWLASAAAAVSVMSMPRLYNYPKVFFYVLAIVVGWRYASRPGRGARAGLALVTAAAFLFRHDHGVYIGAAVVALLVVVHWKQFGRLVTSLTEYGAITLVLLSPFLVFVQTTTGLLRHVRGVLPAAQSASTLRFSWLPVSIDYRAPLVEIGPPSGPRVHIRWATGLDDNARRDLERRHELLSPQHEEDSTWSYVPAYLDRAHIGAIVADPAVVDTHGINRAGNRLESNPPLYLRLQRRFPFLRLRVAPGVFTPENALAWFYYVTFLLPVVTLALVASLLWRGAIGRTEAAGAGMAAVLGLIVVQTLVRGSPDSRLPDVANPIAIIGAWVAAKYLQVGTGGPPLVRRTSSAVVAMLVVLTAWSVGTNAKVTTDLETSGVLTGPSGVWRRASLVTHRLRSRPIDAWSRDSPDLGGLMRYVFECTTTTDRLLVTWFGPEVFFYTERAFAGGQVYLIPGWNASPEDQRLTVERLDRQRVPIVLESVEGEYRQYFPIVAEYVHGRYREVPIRAGTAPDYRVLVDTRLMPSGTYEPLGTPCYR
jgi:hypothetical protein